MRSMIAGLSAGLLMATMVAGAAAQDEDLRMGDDPAYFERVEVPEAGIAVSFPEGWDVEAMMEYDLVDAEDPESGFWRVLFADGLDDGWCSLYRYLDPPGSVAAFTAFLTDSYQDSKGDGATVDWGVLDLPVGETYRIDIQEPAAGGLTSIYVADRAGARYNLTCSSDVRDEDGWIDVAETLEWLPVEGIIDPPQPGPLDEPQPEPNDAPGGEDQRIEAPKAGIALTIPAHWGYEIAMDTGEYQLPAEFDEGSTVPQTHVLSATAPGLGMCILTTYQDMPMSTERHALEHGQQNTSSFVDEDPVISEVELSAGPAIRVDFLATLGWGHAYVFDMDGTRYVLDCFDSDLGVDAFRRIADSIEPLEDEPVDEPEPDDPSEPSIDDRRVEIPEFDMALTIPHFWTYRIDMEEGEYQLPEEFDEGSHVSRTHLLSAFPLGDGLCSVLAFGDMPMDFERHAYEHGWAAWSSLSETTPETTRVQLPAGEASRVVYESLFGLTVAYVFDMAGTRYVVDCLVGSDGGSGARAIAASMAPLGDEPTALGLQRIELADAGIALTLETDWEVIAEWESVGPASVSEDPDVPEVGMWRAMRSYPADDVWCNVYVYDGIPLSLDEHGSWFEHIATTFYDPPMTAVVEPVALPMGDAVRVIETAEDGRVDTIYLFDVAGDREYLVCGTANLRDDAWLSVAESIEPLGDEPGGDEPDIPEGASYWSEVTQFGTQFPVLDPSIEASLMSAWCDRALWFEFPDGTFEERDECRLTDDPVEPPEAQADWPQEAVTLSGGACEWTSDFWLVTDGSDVWASSWSVTVDPDGRAVATATYAAEELDCAED